MTLRSFVKTVLYDRMFRAQRLYVLNFHVITADDDEPGKFGTTTPISAFRESLGLLLEQHKFVDLHEWLSSPALRRTAGHAVALTFDDGHESVVRMALPILEKLEISATFFVNTAYWESSRRICWSNIQSEDRFTHEDRVWTVNEAIGVARRTRDPRLYLRLTEAIEQSAMGNGTIGGRYLQRDELGAIASDSLKIGMHGHYHHRHIMFDAAWQRENVRTNFEHLRSFANFVPLFAFPFGTHMDLTGDSVRICRSEGAIPVFHNGGYNVPSACPGVRRIPADGRDASALVQGQSPFLRKYDI
jgi:peptidoglycan/xylan/chitin deacetylase (PgdA/CDA1 family)